MYSSGFESQLNEQNKFVFKRRDVHTSTYLRSSRKTGHGLGHFKLVDWPWIDAIDW